MAETAGTRREDSKTMHGLRVKLTTLEDLAASEKERSFLQAAFWGDFKNKFGWEAFAVSVEDKYRLLVLVRRVLRFINFAYIPHGPELRWFRTEAAKQGMREPDFLVSISRGIAKILPKKIVFVRWDPDWIVASRRALSDDADDGLEPAIETKHENEQKSTNSFGEADSLLLGTLNSELRKASADIQPPHTVLIDISRDEDTLLAEMKSKTRYNVRLAAKKGVLVEKAGVERLSEWYALYKETAERDQIAVHSLAYYSTLLSANADNMELLLATHEGDLLAGIVVLYWGRRATYLYGASSNFKRNLMPAYTLQWHAIRNAKYRGCDTYDLFGLPPKADPDHPMFGLYQFKTGFGGTLVSFPGSWDFPVRRFLYAIMGIGERLRHFYFKRLKKRR